jgi:peptide/nickel transport system substrate-binding protein
LPILSKKYYENSDLLKEDIYIGTGPYKFVSKNENLLKLKYNDNYYLESIGNIKEIEVKIIPKTRPGFDLLKLGEIDIADTNTEVGAYGRSAYSHSKYITNVFEGIMFNPSNEVLNDNILRQAILLAINRDYIIEQELHGYGVYSDIPVNPNSYLFSKELKKYAFNPERAQDLLTNSGWELKNSIRYKDNNKLELNLLVNGDAKNMIDKANYISKNLSDIGIKLNVVSKAIEEYTYSVRTNEYDLAIVDWALTDYPEFLYNFESNSINNVFGFKNDDYDYLVYLAKREILEGKQKEYFNKMQKILLDELPMIGLYFETSTVFYDKGLDNQLKPKLNDIYSGINNFVFERIEY